MGGEGSSCRLEPGVCGVTPAVQAVSRPVCGCFGCSEPAEHVIHHPEHGERVVCPDHAEGFEVIWDA